MIPAAADALYLEESVVGMSLISSKVGGSHPALSQVMLAATPAVLTYRASCCVGSEASFSSGFSPRSLFSSSWPRR
jgi:hypothetical protein